MNHTEFLILIRRYRILLVFIFILSGIAGGYFLIPHVLVYKGEATFYLSSEDFNPIRPGNDKVDMLSVKASQDRLYQLSFSHEMTRFLIERFNLYEHYNVDSTRKFHFARITKIISRKINIVKINNDFTKVVVSDRNNEIAADMANTLVWKLDKMNKEYFAHKLKAHLNYYSTYLHDIEKTVSDQNSKMIGYMQSLRSLRNEKKEVLSEIEFSVYENANNISTILEELMTLKKLFRSATTAVENNNFPSIVVTRYALPDHKSKKPLLILCALGVSVVVTAAFLIIIYFIHISKDEIKFIFGKNNSEQKPG